MITGATCPPPLIVPSATSGSPSISDTTGSRKPMNEPRVTAIIQARMQSTRLPGKVLKPLAGKPLIAHVISRSKEITPLHRVVLAVPDDTENRPLLALADTMEIESFAGSNQDVLARFYMAAEKFGGDYIVRITGDDPFTDPGYAG